MLKSKPRGFDVDFDFNILTAFKDRIGLAPKGPGALQTCRVWGRVPSIFLLLFDLFFDF
jgi:hypothetical protein